MLELMLSNTYGRLAFLLAIFALVALCAFAMINAGFRRYAIKRGLRDIGGLEAFLPVTGLRSKDNENAWAKLTAGIERAGLNLSDTKNDKLRARLIAAGFTAPSAPQMFTLVRLILVFILPITYVVLSYLGESPPSFLKLYITGSILALLGLYLPNLFIQARADRRREQIVHGFPDCLDLTLVCVEAGLGIEAALDRVGREMVTSHPLVAELLSTTTLHLRAGASREEAFRKLADKAGVDEIRSFTTLLVQSDKLGTSLATTLRVYASEMREKRRMRAEEKAHRIPVLISIPLVACLLPVIIGVLMLPAAIRMVREIFPIMSGG